VPANRSDHWQDLFMQAVDELGPEKLPLLIRDAELAISLRRGELGDSADTNEDWSTMDVASAALRSIRVTQLSGDRSKETSYDCMM
jgi:hypothetical protein